MTQTNRDRLERMVSLPVPPGEVWAEIGDFSAIAEWHPDVILAEMIEIEGETHRHISTSDGGLTLERLVETGPHHYTYEIVESHIPVADFRATFSVVPEAGGCHVFWSALYEPTDAAADEIVSGFYESGLRALRERFGG